MSMTLDINLMSNNNQSYYKYSVRDLKDLFRERGMGGSNLDRDKDLATS